MIGYIKILRSQKSWFFLCGIKIAPCRCTNNRVKEKSRRTSMWNISLYEMFTYRIAQNITYHVVKKHLFRIVLSEIDWYFYVNEWSGKIVWFEWRKWRRRVKESGQYPRNRRSYFQVTIRQSIANIYYWDTSKNRIFIC